MRQRYTIELVSSTHGDSWTWRVKVHGFVVASDECDLLEDAIREATSVIEKEYAK